MAAKRDTCCWALLLLREEEEEEEAEAAVAGVGATVGDVGDVERCRENDGGEMGAGVGLLLDRDSEKSMDDAAVAEPPTEVDDDDDGDVEGDDDDGNVHDGDDDTGEDEEEEEKLKVGETFAATAGGDDADDGGDVALAGLAPAKRFSKSVSAQPL